MTPAKLTGAAAAEPDDTLVRLQKFQTYVSLARNLSLALAVVMAVLVFGLLALRGRGVPVPAEPAATTPATPNDDDRRAAEVARLVDLARSDPGRVAEVFGLMSGAATP